MSPTRDVDGTLRRRTERLFAANWHELFNGDPSDNRNKLTWKNFFAKPELLSIAYNFYSPGDEVVENADETEEFGDFDNLRALLAGGGRHAWVEQEIAKGGQHVIASFGFFNINGGWGFNCDPFASNDWDKGYCRTSVDSFEESLITPAEAAAQISDADLRLKPFHRPFLYRDLYNPELGSAKAGVVTNRFMLLATGIPATSYAIAANPLDKLEKSQSRPSRNINMQEEMKNPKAEESWPPDPDAEDPGDWMHSDFKDVALPHLYPLYKKFIELGELDKQ